MTFSANSWGSDNKKSKLPSALNRGIMKGSVNSNDKYSLTKGFMYIHRQG